MLSIDQSISIGFRYPVHFTTNVFDPHNELLAKSLRMAANDQSGKILFVIDGGVVKHHPRLIESITEYCRATDLNSAFSGTPIVIPGGEVAKNDPAILQSLYQVIHDRAICRHSFVVAVGGGAVLDVVGYAAATAHRGIRLIRIPTTVLAQNDSGVGVKTGINALGKKNFIGAFAPPCAVLNDWSFLATLEDRDWLAGTSEAVKVGLIKDESFFHWVCNHASEIVKRDMPTMQRLIHRCAQLHCEHIAQSGDPFELGSARPLDFGHWAAHKLEQMTNFQLRHGEAVAIGIALDAAYSGLIGLISSDDVHAVHHCLASLRLPLCHSAMSNGAKLIEGLEEFREHLGGPLTITLLRTIGKGFEVNEIDQTIMLQAIKQLASAALSSRMTA